jgi:hypothetical protein
MGQERVNHQRLHFYLLHLSVIYLLNITASNHMVKITPPVNVPVQYY